jgi:hypothetical protein
MTTARALFRERSLPHLASRAFTARCLAHHRRHAERVETLRARKGPIAQSRNIAARGQQIFNSEVSSWVMAMARQHRDTLPGPPLVIIGNGISPASRRAAGKSLLRHLKQRFANMLSTEFGSSSYCVGCGAAMVTTDPKGAARAKGVGDLFFFFFFFFFCFFFFFLNFGFFLFPLHFLLLSHFI